jgi:transposase InsO family protein
LPFLARGLAAAPAGGPAGDGAPLASEGLATLLDLEIAYPAGSAASEWRGPSTYRPDFQGDPLWGTERIRGELLKLGIVVSNRSIRRYRWRRIHPGDHQRWRAFLTNELRGIWAADLFVVQTVSYRTLYVFFLLRHDRREWIHFNVTASPTAAWIWRQLVEATPLGRQPKFLIHDRDADYGGDFDERLATLAITGVRTPAMAPEANAIGERLVRTIRSECLDHVIVINESHLRRVLTEFVDYYNRDRPHRSLGLQSPVSMATQSTGRVISRSVLGGLHHAYARAA